MANAKDFVDSLHSSYPDQSSDSLRSPSPSVEETNQNMERSPDELLDAEDQPAENSFTEGVRNVSSEDTEAPASLYLAEFEYLKGCRQLMRAIDQAALAQNQQPLNASSVCSRRVLQLHCTFNELEGLSAVVQETYRAIQMKIDRFTQAITNTCEQLQREMESVQQQPLPEECVEREAVGPSMPSPASPILGVMPDPVVQLSAGAYSKEGSKSPSPRRPQLPKTVGPTLEVNKDPLVAGDPNLEPNPNEGSLSPSQRRPELPHTAGPELEDKEEPLVDEESSYLESYSSPSWSPPGLAHLFPAPLDYDSPPPPPFALPLLIADRGREEEDTDSLDSSYHSPPRPALLDSSLATSSSSSDALSTADSGYSSGRSSMSETESWASLNHYVFDASPNAYAESPSTVSVEFSDEEPRPFNPELHVARKRRRSYSWDSDDEFSFDTVSTVSSRWYYYYSYTDQEEPSAKRSRQ